MTTKSDPLTSLPNQLALNKALRQAIEAGGSLAVGFLDIDGLLEINTNFGQDTGDRVLREFAALLKAAVSSDVYHISGDEFAVVMPGLSLEQAFLQMEALRGRVQASDSYGLPDGRKLTVTIGVAQFPRDAKTPQALLQAADAALAAAKEGGRNQVALPPNEEMVMKSCYYPASSVRRLKALAERLGRKESPLLREALDDLFRKYDVP